MRTALAWQRTALSLLAGSAILARLTLEELGPLALVSVLVAGPLSAWVFWESRHRYAHHTVIPRGGGAPFALAVATATIALAELAALATRIRG